MLITRSAPSVRRELPQDMDAKGQRPLLAILKAVFHNLKSYHLLEGKFLVNHSTYYGCCDLTIAAEMGNVPHQFMCCMLGPQLLALF